MIIHFTKLTITEQLGLNKPITRFVLYLPQYRSCENDPRGGVIYKKKQKWGNLIGLGKHSDEMQTITLFSLLLEISNMLLVETRR